MAYLLSRIVIFVVWQIKWSLVKTRLIFPAGFITVVLAFFKDWYYANEIMATIIFTAIIFVVAISWIFTLVNSIKSYNRWRVKDIDYAYRISGDPIIATKKSC